MKIPFYGEVLVILQRRYDDDIQQVDLERRDMKLMEGRSDSGQDEGCWPNI